MTLKEKSSYKKIKIHIIPKEEFAAINTINIEDVKEKLYKEGNNTYNKEKDKFCVPIEEKSCSPKKVIIHLGNKFKTTPDISNYLDNKGNVHPKLEKNMWTNVISPMKDKIIHRMNKLPEAKKDNIKFEFTKNWENKPDSRKCGSHVLLACVNEKGLKNIKEKYIDF